mgnify:FL=1
MQTTVLIENAVVLVVIGMSLHKSGKGVLLAMLIAALAHMAFDNSLLTHYSPAQSIADNVSYHWMTSLFFLAMFGLFMANGVKTTKLSFVMAGCMLAQSVLSFAVSINGAVFDGSVFPEFEFIYFAHESFNKAIWIVECIVVYAALTTDDH